MLAQATFSSAKPALLNAMSTRVDDLPRKTCQQLWYLGQKVLYAGRVCLASERALRVFSSARKCISKSERILPQDARDYLQDVRAVMTAKSCAVR